ncbi:hypothetical protein ACU639_36395 [Streptomyces cynarae]|uniref:hypothetical protein n=1 Tax=Streptomyces cynarae TaxID=2981134 RepID=UPI00406C685C
MVVEDEDPAVGLPVAGQGEGVAEPDGGLVTQRKGASLGEGQSAVAAVAAEE